MKHLHFENENYEYGVNQFLRLSALTMLIIYSVVETQFADFSYRVITVFEIIQYPILQIPYFPFFSISFASFGWYPAFLEFFFFFSMLFLFLSPDKRWARTAVLTAITARLLSSHLGTGVHLTSFYLIPILLSCLSRSNNEVTYEHLRRRIITALACMYFFSAALKLNPHYLSGEVLRWDSLVRYSTKAFLTENEIFPFIVWSGLALELLGSLLFVGKFRKLALIATMTFHFAVALSITWSFRLQVTSASILLLFLSQTKSRQYFKYVACLLIVHAVSHYFLYLSAMKWFPALNHQLQDIHGIVFGFILFALGVFYVLTQNIYTQTVWSRGAAIVCTVYALVTIVFSWPEPFGYTQYSGLARNYYGVSVDNQWKNRTKPFSFLKGRWSFKIIDDLYENETTYLFTFENTRQRFIDFICENDPVASFILIHSDHPLNIETGDPDRSKALNSLTKSREKMACK